MTMTLEEQARYGRAMSLLYKFSLERRGWKKFFSRWYYPDEPLRNDAARMVNEFGYDELRPIDSRRYIPNR